MKTVGISKRSAKHHVRCVLCGDALDSSLEKAVWEEEEPHFWLCGNCSSMLTAEYTHLGVPDPALQSLRN